MAQATKPTWMNSTTAPDTRGENPALLAPGYVPLFTYPSASNMDQGIVAMAHRDQPSLENPGTAYKGRSIYTTFGLEGVNDSKSTISRSGLLGAFMTWAMDEPTVVISDVTPVGNGSAMTMFQANITNGVSYRWDFGDGSAILGPCRQRNRPAIPMRPAVTTLCGWKPPTSGAMLP